MVVAAQWLLQSANALGAGMLNFDSLWYHMPFAVDMVQEGLISKEEALSVGRIPPDDLNQLLQRNAEMFQSTKLDKEVIWSLKFERKLYSARFDEAKFTLDAQFDKAEFKDSTWFGGAASGLLAVALATACTGPAGPYKASRIQSSSFLRFFTGTGRMTADVL